MRGTIAWAVPVLVALVCGAGRAAAQDSLRYEPDSTAIPADTVRIYPAEAAGMAGCNVPGRRLLTDSASAAAVLAFPQCRGARLPDLSSVALAGIALSGDCHAAFGVEFWRSDSRREYLVRVTTYDGGCRAMGRGGLRWYELPKLPPGWIVTVMHVRRRLGDWRPSPQAPS